MRTDPNSPIYPQKEKVYSGNAQMGDIDFQNKGITKLEYFSAMAMQALLTDKSITMGNRTAEQTAQTAVMCAKELIKELNSRT